MMINSDGDKVYDSLGEIFVELSELFQPPENVTVAECAAKNRIVHSPGSYIGPWDNDMTPYMVEPMNIWSSHDHRFAAFCGPAQSGKSMCLDEWLPVPDGWKQFKDIHVGDTIFSLDGSRVKVLHETEVFYDRPCYRITFDDHSTLTVDKDHYWSVNDMWADDPYALVVKTTGDMLHGYCVPTSNGRRRFRYSIPVCEPLSLPTASLPIDPYLLGVWLGDGKSSAGYLYLNTNDAPEIIATLRSRGHELSVSPTMGNANGTVLRVTVAGLTANLNALGLLGKKAIPAEYRRASEDQRRWLLKGLMDTDGTSTQNGRVQFSTSVASLADESRELILSLGYKPMRKFVVSPKYRYKGETLTGRPSYTESFYIERGDDAFTLNRHIRRINAHVTKVTTRPTHSGRRFIRKIESVPSVPVKCIAVDHPSHLFLAGRQMVATHNTDAIILNGLVYHVTVEPLDMILYNPGMTPAKDFSTRRIDRLHMHSPNVGAMIRMGRNGDNAFSKIYQNGMILSLSWPSSSEFAGKPIPRVAITDYDRIDDDIDNEGNAFDLASKRTTSFRSFGMTFAESSPSKPITDPKWIRKTPHEAPPATGIFSLYNRGDRRKWYWPCPDCGEFFTGEYSLLKYDESQPTNEEKARTVRMECPHCKTMIHPDSRYEMNKAGVWVKDGCYVKRDRTIEGRAIAPGNFASWWLNGTAAAFVTWPDLVKAMLTAEEEYSRTNDEGPLQKVFNTDLAEPYFPKAMQTDTRTPEEIKSRAEPMIQRRVPKGVRFLVATVDVQLNRFIVQVHGVLPGIPFDAVVVDRFEIRKSTRVDDDGDHERVRPGTYAEDWDLITEQVLEATYELDDDSGRLMGVKLTACDSGGKAGVTTLAYAYWRRVREAGQAHRFILVKGAGYGTNFDIKERVRMTWPDSSDRDNRAAAQGDVPVYLLNSNVLKDSLNTRLDSVTPGRGMIRFPDWLEDWFYTELCSEVRTNKGWEKKLKRNEAWDLLVYLLGVCLTKIIAIEHLDWSNPPSWAADWDRNDHVRDAEGNRKFAPVEESEYDFTQLGRELAS